MPSQCGTWISARPCSTTCNVARIRCMAFCRSKLALTYSTKSGLARWGISLSSLTQTRTVLDHCIEMRGDSSPGSRINGGENTNDPFPVLALVRHDAGRGLGVLHHPCSIQAGCRPGSAIASSPSVFEEVGDGRERPEGSRDF